MTFSTLLVGFENYIPVSRITGILSYTSSRLKQEVSERKKNPSNQLPIFDCTKGKSIKSVVVLDDGTYVLSAVHTDTLAKRLNSNN